MNTNILSPTEFIEKFLDIKLFDHQKKFIDSDTPLRFIGTRRHRVNPDYVLKEINDNNLLIEFKNEQLAKEFFHWYKSLMSNSVCWECKGARTNKGYYDYCQNCGREFEAGVKF